ncbi:MAG TPA: hypothetical protein VGM07_20550 [Stellaceae bacterium]|jgi:hypothetical protein
MILFSIGMPSRFAEWCDALTAKLAEASFGTVECAALNSLEELAAAVLKTRASRLVACSRRPVVHLQTEIIEAERPFLVAIGDPRTALRDLSERMGCDLPEATRAVASSCAAILSLTRAPGALVVSSGDAVDPISVAAAIAEHFELSASRDEIAAIVSELGEAGITPNQVEDSTWWDGLSERHRAVVNGALLPYLRGADLEPLVWEPELFFINDDPPPPTPVTAARLVDITGRVRFLIYGPFVNLPPGSWSANVVLGFSAEAAGMSFMVEIFAGRQLACTRVEPGAEQIIEANLQFAIDDSVDQPVQVRIVNERAAFDGRLALGPVTVAPKASISAETRDQLAAALRQ